MRFLKSNNLAIIGSGGFGREVASVAVISNTWDNIYFIDDAIPKNTLVNGLMVVGDLQSLALFKGYVFVAIGNIKARKFIKQKLEAYERLIFPNIIHPSCKWVQKKNIKLGSGNFIGEGTIGTVDISIGNFNLINIGCLLSHDTKIGSFCNLMHGVKITSGASLNDFINVGAGASILVSREIESGTEIFSNSVIY